MKSYSKMFTPIIVSLLVLLLLMLGTGLLVSRAFVPYVGGVIFVAGVVLSAAFAVYMRVRLRRVSINLGEILGASQAQGLENFPIPIILIMDNGEIAWCNEVCKKNVFQGADNFSKNISELFSGLSINGGSQPLDGVALSYKGKKYTGYIVRAEHDGTTANLLYLVDDTELKNYKERYLTSRTAVMLIMIDNYEELTQNVQDTERSQALAAVECEIVEYMKIYGALLCRTQRDKFLVIVEEGGMREIIASRFSILDRVRKIESAPKIPTTLSIGVGQHAATLAEAESMARQALDMSLGRGGDQAAVKTTSGYEFYGGVSKGVEKRTKVKTRIIATALVELINSSSNIVIMGHRFADLDCVGAAAGMYKAVSLLGKPAHICVNVQRTLAMPLISRLSQDESYNGAFLSPAELMEKIQKNTLLIIVDVHAKHFVESLELYEKASSVVVIDHHRKMVDYIDNAVIFYHEPYASSASEMVAELVQYFGLGKNLGSTEAEALLAGIMLDTKNFVLKAGVRTFEAAAYLKRLGADTMEIRKLFSSPMEAYQKKARIVSSATVYRRCAIAVSQGFVEDIKLIAPQSADELLSISDVDASFVIFENGTSVELSARSMGAVNVQLIMEKMGGGGHMNMAAAQLPGAEIEDVQRTLLSAIDEHFDSLGGA